MPVRSIYHTFQRFRTLQTHKITALPIVILMPHSACNCRCVMCDIWKDNRNLKQLTEKDVQGLLSSLKKFGTRQVLMSGGEALLHPNFFALCAMLRKEGIKISLLSTGLTLTKNAAALVESVNDIILSIDGAGVLHDAIRNISGAFNKITKGVEAIRALEPRFKIRARTVIHQLNFRNWPAIIEAAKKMGLDQISFLPADVSSHAFNREVLWSDARQQDILVGQADLAQLKEIIQSITADYAKEFQNHFIAESPEKIQKIYEYYAAFYELNPFPYKKCNAPWVSAVIEADGTVRPCFFHEAIGNIHDQSLDQVLNSEQGMKFRETLDMDTNPICKKCVCYLNLPVQTNPG